MKGVIQMLIHASKINNDRVHKTYTSESVFDRLPVVQEEYRKTGIVTDEMKRMMKRWVVNEEQFMNL